MTTETQAEIQKDFGFVPNLLQEMSKSPAAPLVYVKGQKIMENANLSAEEQQIVQLAASVFNECAYCTSAHSAISKSMGIDVKDIISLREGAFPENENHAGIAYATRLVMEKQGHLTRMDIRILESMGIGRAKLYEIIAHIGLKTINNYIAHIVQPEIDAEFRFDE